MPWHEPGAALRLRRDRGSAHIEFLGRCRMIIDLLADSPRGDGASFTTNQSQAHDQAGTLDPTALSRHQRVRELYERLDTEITGRKPLCINRGDCCKFDSYGHRLYVTAVELEYFLAQQQPAGLRPVTSGACP